MEELLVTLGKDVELDFDHVDVGATEDVIAFEVEGVIRGLDDSILAALVGPSLVPTEIHFKVESE